MTWKPNHLFLDWLIEEAKRHNGEEGKKEPSLLNALGKGFDFFDVIEKIRCVAKQKKIEYYISN